MPSDALVCNLFTAITIVCTGKHIQKLTYRRKEDLSFEVFFFLSLICEVSSSKSLFCSIDDGDVGDGDGDALPSTTGSGEDGNPKSTRASAITKEGFTKIVIKRCCNGSSSLRPCRRVNIHASCIRASSWGVVVAIAMLNQKRCPNVVMNVTKTSGVQLLTGSRTVLKEYVISKAIPTTLGLHHTMGLSPACPIIHPHQDRHQTLP